MKFPAANALVYYKLSDVLAAAGLAQATILHFIARLSYTGISWGDDDQRTLVPWARVRLELKDFLEDEGEDGEGDEDSGVAPIKGWFHLLPAAALVSLDF